MRLTVAVAAILIYLALIGFAAWRLSKRPYCPYCYEPEGDCEADCPHRVLREMAQND